MVELLVVVLSTFALLLRFWRVDSIPGGFHTDESVALANSVCLRHTGVDLWGHSWSLFSGGPINDFGYTVSAPGHLYVIYSLWLSVIGDSIAAARSFEVFNSLIIVAATVGIAHNFLGRSGAVWALGLSAISPWTWTLSRVAFVTPNFLTMHLFAGLWIITRHIRHRATPSTTEIIMSALLFGMAASRYYSALSAALVGGAIGWYFFAGERRNRMSVLFSGIIVVTFVVMQVGLASHT
ncbi:MAG: glycosyltransferase family 39 protein, partial [Actinomycetota bacterium]